MIKGDNEQKQVFWFTIISYIGIVVGIVSTIYIYPNDKAFLGIVRYVDAIAQLLFPVMVFGAGQALIYFYPTVNTNIKKDLFKYGITSTVVLSIVLLGMVFLGKQIVTFENYEYIFYAFPIAFSLAFIELFKRQATNMNKLAVPTFFEKIIPKLALPIIFIFLLSGYLEVVNGLLAFIVSYAIIFILLAFYVFKRYPIRLNFNFKPLFSQIAKKEYYKYSFYAFLGSFGSFLAFRLDVLMIPGFLSFEANGTYSIGVVLASVIAVPATGMFAIYAPLVSKYLKENDFELLRKKYVENAKLLFFVGAILYGGILLGLNSLFKLLPTYEKLVDSIPVVFILGANVLFNMGTGFSSEIISYSKFYRTNILLLLILVVLNIGLNFYVLTQTDYGLVGVAWASLIAMTIFNIVKLFFIYGKFGMWPFDKGYLKLILIVFTTGLLFYWIPEMPNNIINIFVKSGLYAIITVFVVYKLKLVYSLNFWVNKVLKINS
jgi:O-antigen/teichoic acid export membrane protein